MKIRNTYNLLYFLPFPGTDLFTQSHIEQAYLRSIRYETAPDEDHMESGELPSLSTPRPGLRESGLAKTQRSLSNGELTSMPAGNKSLSINELFHATQSFII